jgi:proteasome lid subunit RPN8/RPN11
MNAAARCSEKTAWFVKRLSCRIRRKKGPRRRFLVRPDDYRVAEKRAREAGLDLLGFYHSHPDHPARPSQYDLDHAWPFFSYVIVSVMAGKDALLTSWQLKEDRSAFDEERLEITNNKQRITKTWRPRS